MTAANPQGISQILGHDSTSICRLLFDKIWTDSQGVNLTFQWYMALVSSTPECRRDFETPLVNLRHNACNVLIMQAGLDQSGPVRGRIKFRGAFFQVALAHPSSLSHLTILADQFDEPGLCFTQPPSPNLG